jgi:hypothetical protein
MQAPGEESNPEEDDTTVDDERTPLRHHHAAPAPGGSDAAAAAPTLLRSPHGRGMKCLYGSSMVSPWCAIIGVGVSRDIYALKYGADIGTLGTLQLIHGVVFIFTDIIIGYIQVSSCCLSPCVLRCSFRR